MGTHSGDNQLCVSNNSKHLSVTQFLSAQPLDFVSVPFSLTEYGVSWILAKLDSICKGRSPCHDFLNWLPLALAGSGSISRQLGALEELSKPFQL